MNHVSVILLIGPHVLIISGSKKQHLYAIIFFANSWQLLVSLNYLLFNALLTSFCVEAEWQSYAIKKKALRTTFPEGQQRSTYFLSLPARYALPMQALFTLLHWTLSQGVFVTVIESYTWDGQLFSGVPFLMISAPPCVTCKSPPYLIQIHLLKPMVAVLLGMFMSTLFLFLAFRKHPGYMPTGATCSVVLSAACHQPLADINAATEPVQWGVIPFEDSPPQIQEGNPPKGTSTAMGVVDIEVASSWSIGWLFNDPFFEVDGHCCFTTRTVGLPLIGRKYI